MLGSASLGLENAKRADALAQDQHCDELAGGAGGQCTISHFRAKCCTSSCTVNILTSQSLP
jgi:hypothetical protein